MTQFGVLIEIERRGEKPPTIRELAEALVMDQSTIGQNLRPLDREGLVTLEADASDGRRRRVKLTREAGRVSKRPGPCGARPRRGLNAASANSPRRNCAPR